MDPNPFFEDLVLDTPEAVANMEEAFESAERGGGYKVEGDLELCTDPECIRRFVHGGDPPRMMLQIDSRGLSLYNQGRTLMRMPFRSGLYQIGDTVTTSGNVTVTPVWSSNVPPIIFDEEEEETIGSTASGSESKDDTVTVVACAAAAVVAALMAAFLIIDRKH